MPADAYEAMSSISTHAPAADAASATTARDRIIVAAVRCASNPFRAAPNPNSVLGARAALNLDSECPTGMLVVAFAPRLRQKMRCTMRRELSSATCIDTLGFGQTRHAAL